MIHRSRLRRPQSPTNCREVGRVIQSFLDDDVEEGFAEKIAAHLEECKRCGLEAETYERIKSAMAARRDEVDPEVLDRLRSFGKSLTESD